MKISSVLTENGLDSFLPTGQEAILHAIHARLDEELLVKQKMIEEQKEKIIHLEEKLDHVQLLILEKQEQLEACSRQKEGTKQLVNKLLGDIDRLQLDIEWYKRTYEKRSMLGTIKQKLFKK